MSNPNPPPKRTVEECASIFAWVASAAAAVAAVEGYAALSGADQSDPDPISFDEVLGLASYMGYDENYINNMLGKSDPASLSTDFISKYDTDGDRELTLAELNLALQLEGFNIELSEDAFAYFDKDDGNGKLSVDEIDNMQRNEVGDELVVRKINNRYILGIAPTTKPTDSISRWNSSWRLVERNRRKQWTFEQSERRIELRNQLKQAREAVDDRIKGGLRNIALGGAGLAAMYTGAETLDKIMAGAANGKREQAATEEGLQKALLMSEASEESSFHRDSRGKIVPNDDEECPICGDVLVLADAGWIIRRCGHAFCASCASEWGKRGHDTCPVCVRTGEDFHPEDGRKIYKLRF